MKKLKTLIKSAILFAVAGLTFGLTSCTNDNLESTDGSADKLYIIYGGFAQNDDSRMSLNTTTNHYDWQVGDGVCLYKEDGSLLTYHAITSSEIQANGIVRLELRLSSQPKYITIAGRNGSYAQDGAHVDVNGSGLIDMYSIASTGILNGGAPVLGQSEFSTSIVNGVAVNSFTIQHKLAYIYIKSIKIDGVALNNVYVSAVSGTMAITDVKSPNAEVMLSNLTPVSSNNVMTGIVIAVIPGTTLIISKDASSTPFVNAKLEPGFYTVERDITTITNSTVSFASDDAAKGSVSSASQTVVDGQAANPVTATANTGYVFEGWYCNGVKLGASGTDANGNEYTVNGNVLTINKVNADATYTAKFEAEEAQSCKYLNATQLVNRTVKNMQVVVGETYIVKTKDSNDEAHTFTITINGLNSYSATVDDRSTVLTSMENITLSNGYLSLSYLGDGSYECSDKLSLCTNPIYKDLMTNRCSEMCGFGGTGYVTSISAKNGNCSKIFVATDGDACTYISQATVKSGYINRMHVVVGETYTIKGQSGNGTIHTFVITITGSNSYSLVYDGGAATTSSPLVGITNSYLSVSMPGNTLDNCLSAISLCTNTVYQESLVGRCDGTCGFDGSAIISVAAKNGNCSQSYDVKSTVTYNPNGGSVSPTTATVNRGNSVTLPSPTRNGYTFNGWYTSSTGGTRVGGVGNSYTPNGNTVLYAQWSLTTKSGDVYFGGKYWDLLTTSNGKILVITSAIDFHHRMYAQRYNIQNTDYWAGSELRSYLNGTYYNNFSSAEKAAIILTNNENKKTSKQVHGFDTGGYKVGTNLGTGSNTNDNVFCLSEAEANQYLGCTTAYYLISDYDDYANTFWLRSTAGYYPEDGYCWSFAVVDPTKRIISDWGYCDNAGIGVRPAMWLDLSKLKYNGSGLLILK